MLIKIFIFLTCIFFNGHVNANTWQDYWVKAVESCHEKDYIAAIEMFDLAVDCMEKEEDLDHPYVYVDRARLNLLLEKNELAIADLDKALANSKITQREKSRAAISRMIAKTRLGIDKGVLEDLHLFAENSENKPIVERTKEKIIIRNAPDCSCYRKLMTCYFIHSGVCESKNDIQMLNSGIWLVKKRNGCNCNASFEKLQKDRVCDECGAVITAQNTPDQIAGCKKWCDRAAIAGAAWCGKVFKTLKL